MDIERVVYSEKHLIPMDIKRDVNSIFFCAADVVWSLECLWERTSFFLSWRECVWKKAASEGDNERKTSRPKHFIP